MICDECGKQYFDDAKYCPFCGSLISNKIDERGHEFKSPLIITKPVFVPIIIFLSSLPLHLILTLWSAGFFGGVFWGIVIALDKYIPLDLSFYLPFGSTFLYSGILTFLLIPILTYIVKKKKYAETEYNIYSDCIISIEGIKNSKKKIIKYKNIIVAELVKNSIQKKYGLGTISISLSEAGTEKLRRPAGTDLKISDIQNSEKIYNQILDLKK